MPECSPRAGEGGWEATAELCREHRRRSVPWGSVNADSAALALLVACQSPCGARALCRCRWTGQRQVRRVSPLPRAVRRSLLPPPVFRWASERGLAPVKTPGPPEERQTFESTGQFSSEAAQMRTPYLTPSNRSMYRPATDPMN